MLAFPVKILKNESSFFPYFSKAKHFVIFDGKEFYIEKNEHKDSLEVANWLTSLGVNKVLINKICKVPYEKIVSEGFEIFKINNDNIEIPKILEKIKRKEFKLLTSTDSESILNSDELAS